MRFCLHGVSFQVSGRGGSWVPLSLEHLVQARENFGSTLFSWLCSHGIRKADILGDWWVLSRICSSGLELGFLDPGRGRGCLPSDAQGPRSNWAHGSVQGSEGSVLLRSQVLRQNQVLPRTIQDVLEEEMNSLGDWALSSSVLCRTCIRSLVPPLTPLPT